MQNSINNHVDITGIIFEPPMYSHSIYQESFYNIKVAIKRLSNFVDILPVTVSQKLVEIESLTTGQLVSVCGQLRSYNKLTENGNRLILTVFAHEVNFDPAPLKNYITLTGFLCKTPIYRTTPFNREISDLLLASNRAYNKSDYIPCITWGQNARLVKNLEIGTCIVTEGRIQSREYQKIDTDGQIINRVAYEVSLSSINCVNSNSN